MMDDGQARRLDEARGRMHAALLALAPLGSEALRVALVELEAAWAEYEDAFTDRLTALILGRDLASRETQQRNTARLDGLEAWAYGGEITVTRIPPPGADDPDEAHP